MEKILSGKKTARIIVTYASLPNVTLGSWSQHIEYWLQKYSDNQIDYLLCSPSPVELTSTKTKRIVCNIWKLELNNKTYQNLRYGSFIKALENIIPQFDYCSILVIDNTKLKNIVSETIAKHNWQNKTRVIYNQQGWSYEFDRDQWKHFKNGLNEMILLTQNAYQHEIAKYHEYPFQVHIIPNAIRKELFFKVSPEQKLIFRKNIGISETEKLFLWVSHDRPKKGLDIILRSWAEIGEKYSNAKLFVVGAKREISLPGLHFVGRLPNADIAKYYQAADVFLFSTLCQEGYGISLAEAMSSGCYCMSSTVGGLGDYFNSSNGKVIDSPQQTSCWVAAIEEYLQSPETHIPGDVPNFVDYDECSRKTQKVMNDAIYFLAKSNEKK